jgi:hypothetical protein
LVKGEEPTEKRDEREYTLYIFAWYLFQPKKGGAGGEEKDDRDRGMEMRWRCCLKMTGAGTLESSEQI